MNQGGEQEQEQDMVMPGFRFHPTEEELVEFYLRRKVQGKKFNVDLITLLDLYRFDPWELPALAAIGEKDWYFYVPRDRKYRNGDRPNRVTTSGYWKATGADRTIRSENCRSIGLKKTLVFYSGKAPKGIRTSWIMNEYRLPHHETLLLQKAEISLCRVYKRAGIQDQPCLPRATTKQSSKKQREISHRSYHKNPLNQMDDKTDETSGSSSSNSCIALIPSTSETASTVVPRASLLVPNCTSTVFSGSTTSNSYIEPLYAVDDLHGLINYQKQQASLMVNNHHHRQEFPTNLQLQPIVNRSVHTGFPDRPWDWNLLTDHEIRKDYTAPY